VFFVVCDGLKGLPDSVNAVWPQAMVQTCIIHLIRGSFRYASKRYWPELAADLKPIYTAPTVEAAESALEAVEEKWGKPYPAIPRLWRSAWELFTPFLDYVDGVQQRLDPPPRRLRLRRHQVGGVVGAAPLPGGARKRGLDR
jgi:putative transposase